MDIINGSSLTTEREREVFAAIVRDFIERELPTAPREKLHDIELVMRGWRPTADHRKRSHLPISTMSATIPAFHLRAE